MPVSLSDTPAARERETFLHSAALVEESDCEWSTEAGLTQNQGGEESNVWEEDKMVALKHGKVRKKQEGGGGRVAGGRGDRWLPKRL